MLMQALHNQNNVLGAALGGLSKRIDVMTNNLANVDTPGFIASTVYFEDQLSQAISNWRSGGGLDLTGVQPRRARANHGTFRLDGNNVDIEREMAKLYINTVKYDAIALSIQNNSRRLNLAITGR